MAAAGTAVFGYQFLSPNVLYEPSPIVNMGKPESYPPDSVTLDVECGIYVVHAQEGFFVSQCRMHASGLPDRMEAGSGDHRLPLPWQQIRRFRTCGKRPGDKIEGPAPKPLPWLRDVAE